MPKSFNFIEYERGGRGRPRGGINNTDLWLLPPTRSVGKGVLLRIPILVLRNLGSPPRIRVLYDLVNKAFSVRPEKDDSPGPGYKVLYQTKQGKRMSTFSVELTRLLPEDMPLGSYKAIQPDVFIFDTALPVTEEEVG